MYFQHRRPAYYEIPFLYDGIVNAEEEEGADILADRPDRTTTSHKMEIARGMMEVMTNNPNGFQSEIKMKGQTIDAVENFKCHASIMSNDGSKPYMSRVMTKPTKWLCAQRRLKWAWESAQSDQSLRCALNGLLRTQTFFVRTAKTLIRLGGCPGWSESSLDAQPFCWFCHVVAQIISITLDYYYYCPDILWRSYGGTRTSRLLLRLSWWAGSSHLPSCMPVKAGPLQDHVTNEEVRMRIEDAITVYRETAETHLGKKTNICVSGFSSEKTRYWSAGITFCQNTLYRNCIFPYIFPHFPANLTTFCSQLTIKCLGSGQKPR